MDNKEVAKKFKQCFTVSRSGLAKQWSNTRDCQQFYIGDSMEYEDKIQYQVQGQKKRALVRFNKVMVYVDGVVTITVLR